MLPSAELIAELAVSLPVSRHRAEILERLARSPVIVVESPTGSGKTTQLPRILYEAGYGRDRRIGVTQPRRIAAVSVSEFIRAQLQATQDAEAGADPDLVAYKMRFEDTTSERTRIKIMTDGVLLQELKHDRLLREYAVLMIDEAHERSLNIDFVLGLLKGVLAQRPEFKVIVSSATINAEVFSEYFDECPIVRIDTPQHPVQIHYRPFQPAGDPEQLQAAIERLVLEIHRAGRRGDVLIFLSGERDIRACIARLGARPESRRWQLLPLFARLPQAEQGLVFEPFPQRRKIVVATNIAETSITIPGIGFVIDSGLAKINSYHTRTLTAALTEQPISHASCNQRRGRAGRTGPGACYRLYSEQSYRQRPLFQLEEIHRTDLSEVVLRMADLGITEFEEFDFLSPPGRERIASGVQLLELLDALDPERALTDVGRLMVQFPILPRHARMLVEAIHRYPDVIEETLIAAAFLSVPSPLVLPEGNELEARHAHHRFRHPLGDLVAYLHLFRDFRDSDDREGFCARNYLEPRTMFEIVNIKGQLEEIVAGLGLLPAAAAGAPDSSGAGTMSRHGRAVTGKTVSSGAQSSPAAQLARTSHYLCAVARGLIQFVCVAVGPGRYRSPTAGNIFIHPGSGMYGQQARYLVAGEVVRTSRTYARSVSPLRREEVRAISPDLLAELVAVSQPGSRRDRRRSGAGARAGTGAPGPDRYGAQAGDHQGDPRAGAQRRPEEQVRILGQTFALAAHGSKGSLVTLPWSQAAPLARRAGHRALAPHRKLRGKIVLDGAEIMTGARLSVLFEVLRKIDPAHRVTEVWPRETLRLPDDAGPLLGQLDQLLALAPRTPAGNKLAFLALQRVASGGFRLAPRRSLQTAVAESLAALEELADAPAGTLDGAQQARLSAAYRRVSDLL